MAYWGTVVAFIADLSIDDRHADHRGVLDDQNTAWARLRRP
ncbi:hypothetical protein L861_06630 [Litchfieldella anticariensis FP35 = DSM 16096]|uniref:Uncharacterized protein n=1 Tax=Litchfieldella anticariensis (strain DSM 16096 / CECT 5854 / CIP 108499 / LMG 22089 / FP35) TaxID=1121939 RepID=S2KFB6_LITA3|nr:hypothetical protein L861_06630 [Halomonas anticariensis FP35 = DSM 16096]